MALLKKTKTTDAETQSAVGPRALLSMRRASLREYAVVVVGLLVVAGGVLLFAASNSVVALVQAEQMNLPKGATVFIDPSASGGKAVLMTRSDRMSGQVTLPSAATSLTVMAEGTACNNQWPQMGLVVDGQTLNVFTVNSSSWASYTYNFQNPLSTGTHSVLLGFGNSGNLHNCPRTLKVDVTTFYGPGSPPDTTPPNVSFTAPTANSTVSGTTTISAAATDNSAVASVQFKLDGANLGPLETIPSSGSTYSYVWNTSGVAAGSHTLTAVATDTSGNQANATDAITVGSGSGGGVTYGTVTHPFAATAPINEPIPANPKYVANNGVVTAVGLDFSGYGWPLYQATSPFANVKCVLYCYAPFVKGQVTSMPFPTGLKTSSGSDYPAGIVNPATGQTYEFWQLSGSGTSWSANGAGTGNITSSSIIGNATGSGISIFAGTVTLADLNSGTIAHALNFGTSATCSGTHEFPAAYTDGTTSGNCIPEGARVQLDPSVDLSKMTKFEQMVGKAMQVYGGYCGDTAGSNGVMAIRFEDTADIGVTGALSNGQSNYYTLNNIKDWTASLGDLDALPASDWHILNSWNGQ